MTPEEYFTKLASKLNLTEVERQRISVKHLSLRESLRERLPVEDDFLTGSYPRNTMIRPKGDGKFDVDFFLAFRNEDFGEYELPKLLEMVRSTLEGIQDVNSEIIGITDQNRSIAVEYQNCFQIDVVPAIELRKDQMYKIFDKRTQQPVESNPKLHGRNLSEANLSTEYGSVRRLVPIIKLLKSWKRDKCDFVKSFHLELLVVEILKNQPIETYSVGLREFFSVAGEYLREASLTDPANEENLIDVYLDDDGTRQELLDLIAAGNEIADAAYRYETDGENEAAVDEWRRIFESDESRGSGSVSPKSSGPTIISRPPKQHYYVHDGID
jgi:hypothetical protein